MIHIIITQKNKNIGMLMFEMNNKKSFKTFLRNEKLCNYFFISIIFVIMAFNISLSYLTNTGSSLEPTEIKNIRFLEEVIMLWAL